MQRVGRTIPPGACPDTPSHLEEFNRGYTSEYPKEVLIRRPIDNRAHPMLNYSRKQKMVEGARENNLMNNQRIWGWTTDFGRSFISTFMPQ